MEEGMIIPSSGQRTLAADIKWYSQSHDEVFHRGPHHAWSHYGIDVGAWPNHQNQTSADPFSVKITHLIRSRQCSYNGRSESRIAQTHASTKDSRVSGDTKPAASRL